MNGFLLIDKPKGVTSFYCVKVLRKVFGMKRIGFVGTLDPLATGLMIFALGEATKLISYLEGTDKVYYVAICLGARSNTYDAEGTIEAAGGFDNDVRRLGRALIEEVLEEKFIGDLQQKPPKYSAIQIEGKRAYDLARKGVSVEMKSRKVKIHDIKIKSYSWPVLRLEVHCGSGTYIRSLAHDLGVDLGCGGYVKELRRTKSGSFNVKDAVDLGTLSENNSHKHLILPQELFKDWSHLRLNDRDYGSLSDGGFIENVSEIRKGNLLAIHDNNCVGMLEVHRGKLKFAKKFNIVDRA